MRIISLTLLLTIFCLSCNSYSSKSHKESISKEHYKDTIDGSVLHLRDIEYLLENINNFDKTDNYIQSLGFKGKLNDTSNVAAIYTSKAKGVYGKPINW